MGCPEMSQPIEVSSPEAGKKTSTIINTVDNQDTVQLDAENANCYWNDQAFNKGDRVINDSKCYECGFGLWTEVS